MRSRVLCEACGTLTESCKSSRDRACATKGPTAGIASGARRQDATRTKSPWSSALICDSVALKGVSNVQLAASFVAQGWRLDTSATGSEDLSTFEPPRAPSVGSETNTRRLLLLASVRACGERRIEEVVCGDERLRIVFQRVGSYRVYPSDRRMTPWSADFPRLPCYSRTRICEYTRALWKSSDSIPSQKGLRLATTASE